MAGHGIFPVSLCKSDQQPTTVLFASLTHAAVTLTTPRTETAIISALLYAFSFRPTLTGVAHVTEITTLYLIIYAARKGPNCDSRVERVKAVMLIIKASLLLLITFGKFVIVIPR